MEPFERPSERFHWNSFWDFIDRLKSQNRLVQYNKQYHSKLVLICSLSRYKQRGYWFILTKKQPLLGENPQLDYNIVSQSMSEHRTKPWDRVYHAVTLKRGNRDKRNLEYIKYSQKRNLAQSSQKKIPQTKRYRYENSTPTVFKCPWTREIQRIIQVAIFSAYIMFFKTSDVESGLFSPIFLRKFENLNNSPTTDKNNSGFGITLSKMKACFEVKYNPLAYIIYCVTYRMHDMNCCVTIVHSQKFYRQIHGKHSQKSDDNCRFVSPCKFGGYLAVFLIDMSRKEK